MTEAEVLLDQYRQIIEMQCPSDHAHLSDNPECFDLAPIHRSWSLNGRIMGVEMDLEGATPLLLAAAWRIAAEYIRDFHGEYSAAEKLGRLANEIQTRNRGET
jgi:hypothetical protein